MTVQEQVRRYILEFFYVSDPADLTDEISLIDSGVVDSTGMMDVILFLEDEYGIHIEDRETTPENLDSISRIAAFIASKQHAAAPFDQAAPRDAAVPEAAGDPAAADGHVLAGALPMDSPSEA